VLIGELPTLEKLLHIIEVFGRRLNHEPPSTKRGVGAETFSHKIHIMEGRKELVHFVSALDICINIKYLHAIVSSQLKGTQLGQGDVDKPRLEICGVE
jgi:hypothetical protein